jgi:hypothetical protein
MAVAGWIDGNRDLNILAIKRSEDCKSKSSLYTKDTLRIIAKCAYDAAA